MNNLLLFLMLLPVPSFAATPPYPMLKPGCDAANYPPQQKDWSISVDPAEKPWTFSFMISEIAEPYLGTKIFESLPDRFSRIPGVIRVIQDDRECYLIQSKGLKASQLKDAMWKTFKAAAAEACGRG
jgi:hypothetical protein